MAINKSEMEAYRTAKLASKKREKWWGQHSTLSTIAAIAIVAAVYLSFHLIFGTMPRLLSALGVTPSGILLSLGTVFCGIGVCGLRRWREQSGIWLLIYVWCTLQGIVDLGRAMALI
jgi:hypothetical protein